MGWRSERLKMCEVPHETQGFFLKVMLQVLWAAIQVFIGLKDASNGVEMRKNHRLWKTATRGSGMGAGLAS